MQKIFDGKGREARLKVLKSQKLLRLHNNNTMNLTNNEIIIQK